MSERRAGDVAVRVTHVSKMFKVYEKPSDLFVELLTRKRRHRECWALRDVTFEVGRGEVVGIIGRNGAGKSTLLKIVAGIMTDFESGTVEVNGRVSSILELGTGFHPEYTGRQNIFMGGTMIGMSDGEIRRKLDSIIDFAELRHVIDQPFRTYSSGMQARLTFATAISIDPEVFVVDEALAAGDAAFVSKCMKRITEICKSGATVLFVTHGTELVRRLCNSAIYLENGAIKQQGEASYVTGVYDLDTLDIASATFARQQAGTTANRGPANIVEVDILDRAGEPCAAFFQHDTVRLRLTIACDEATDNPAIWLKFCRLDGILATTWFSHEPELHDIGRLPRGRSEVELVLDDVLLGDGDYELSFALFEGRTNRADTAYYADPMSIWERTHRMKVQRRGRPLVTLFDQPVRVAEVRPAGAVPEGRAAAEATAEGIPGTRSASDRLR